MSYNIPDKDITRSGIQSVEKSPFVIGADVIAYLTQIKYPMIMVDRIIYYNSDPLSLVAERYVSANEPAFVGHFPNMKLWPGIYTLEGLRQSCYLLYILHELEEADMLKGVIELHNRQILRPQIDHKLCQSVIDYLKNSKMYDPDLFSIRIKLLEPVFAGSLIKYHCFRDADDLHCWSVQAVVDERLIAKGTIIQSFNISP
jgi:3-hydroxymyristoyl/3-hydroxydecanoyl-(acyl carrier protein) dehydratase